MNNQALELPQRRDSDIPPQTILVVDDDVPNVEFLQQGLARQGFEVHAAHSAQQAMHRASEKRPDAILLNLCLPDMDGFELCQQFADSPDTGNVPVIALSELQKPGVVRASRAAGCCFYMHKPYDPNALLLLIRHAIQEANDY